MKSELVIKYEQYLKYIGRGNEWSGSDINRIIEAAFLAGAQANEDVREEICIKLIAE
jgi:hypothetical protein